MTAVGQVGYGGGCDGRVIPVRRIQILSPLKVEPRGLAGRAGGRRRRGRLKEVPRRFT